MTRFSTGKKIGLIGAALLAGGLFAATAAAQMPPGRGSGPMAGGPGVQHEAVAEALGVSSDELFALRAGGQSFAQIAADRGMAIEDVTAAMLETHKAWLDQRVQAGSLTQAQADAMLSMMQAHFEANVEPTGAGSHFGMMGPPAGHRMGSGGMGPQPGRGMGVGGMRP